MNFDKLTIDFKKREKLVEKRAFKNKERQQTKKLVKF